MQTLEAPQRVAVRAVPPPELAERWAKYDGLSIEELKQELRGQLRLTAEHFENAAQIVLRLEEKGVDLSELKLLLLPYIRKIAYGTLRATALHRLLSKDYVLSPLSRLPINDQDHLLEHGVKLGVRKEDGSVSETRPKAMESLTKVEAQVVFDPRGAWRRPAEQLAWQREQEQIRRVPEGLPFRFEKAVVDVIRPFRMTKRDFMGLGKAMGWL
jgi:hypothetical protein